MTKRIPQERTLIFQHLPKTGGSTLSSILRRQYPENVQYHITPGRHDTVPIEKFKNLSDQRKRKIKLLSGHLPFGLHEYLPQPAVYCTMLRKPVDRIISLYYYILRFPAHYLYERITSSNMTLQDFASSRIAATLDNGQTRFLCGIPEVGTASFSEVISSAHLETAKKNIRDRFAAIGLTERFDESVILMSRILGWKMPYYVKRNVTRGRITKREIPKNTIEVIEKYNELDMQLYEYVLARFESLIKQQSVSLEHDLKKLKLCNRFFEIPYNILNTFGWRHRVDKLGSRLIKLQRFWKS